MCPSKFANLILPTYIIDINFSMDIDDLQNSAIEMLINKNQNGELSFTFIPKSFENNVYRGKLIVDYSIDNLSIPLKKLLKGIHTKKYYEGWYYILFNDVYNIKYFRFI